MRCSTLPRVQSNPALSYYLSFNKIAEKEAGFLTFVLIDYIACYRKREKLDASCEHRQCVTNTENLRTSPCSNYSLHIDGLSELRIVTTPPSE